MADKLTRGDVERVAKKAKYSQLVDVLGIERVILIGSIALECWSKHNKNLETEVEKFTLKV
jgi:hypothetical protein